MSEMAYAETMETAEQVAPPGPVSAEHIHFVRESYRHIQPASGLIAELFFRRLIEVAPDLEPMLDPDKGEQHRQVLGALSLAVASLDRFDQITPALNLLGAKYRGMGIEEVHYGAVGEALLWTLHQSLGPQWSSDIEDAWTAAFTAIAETMTANR